MRFESNRRDELLCARWLGQDSMEYQLARCDVMIMGDESARRESIEESVAMGRGNLQTMGRKKFEKPEGR